jgi:penicillin-binding protein 1A
MLWGYTIFAGRGFSTKPYCISRIEDRNGNVIKRFDFSTNRKEVVSEITAYTMTRMMQGTVDKGTAGGMRSRVGATEMGGKTGTTQSNADAWFIGYTPQLLAGSWVGFDDQFIRNEGDGNRIARPIPEYFFKKVLADKRLGIEKDARFVRPAEMENEINSADNIPVSDTDPLPGGDDQGVGNEQDYYINNNEYIGPESKPVQEEDNKPTKKDTITKSPIKREEDNSKPIGTPVDQPKKKKGLLQRIFGNQNN